MPKNVATEDERSPYDPPLVRDLGPVVEITRGIGLPSTDDGTLSAPI
ncbi:MAG: hypothetical protein LC722_02580 [Actinobacteria bacterium]|nr:hypothetical protein [Actinomycetota bacterium]